MKTSALLASLALATCVGVLLPATQAHAEPVASSYAIVGSDSMQDAVNALVDGTTTSGAKVRSTAGDQFMASYAAVGSRTISTKPYGPRFGRPYATNDGLLALKASMTSGQFRVYPGGKLNANIGGQIDIVRAGEGPATVDPAGNVAYIPFGRDALSYTYVGGNPALANLTRQQLTDLYTCVNTSPNGVAVTPVLPIYRNAQRSQFLKAINVTEAQILNAACVYYNGISNDTTALFGNQPFPANGLAPVSVAQWVSQSNGLSVDHRAATAAIGSIDGVAAVTGAGATAAPNKAFYDSPVWGHDVYLVVEAARIDAASPTYDAKLADAVGTAGSKLGNTQSALPSQAGSVKKKYGFLAPSKTAVIRTTLA